VQIEVKILLRADYSFMNQVHIQLCPVFFPLRRDKICLENISLENFIKEREIKWPIMPL
jgi:hypothetical protein